MDTPPSLLERLDLWARSHSRWMLAAILVAAAVAAVLSLSASQAPVVLYQDF